MALPVLSVNAMRAWEAATWDAGVDPGTVIQRVGDRLAAALLARTAPHDRLLLLAGSGHNGDDLRAAVRGLGGREVRLLEVSDPVAGLHALEALGAGGWEPAWCVDGLFGIGLNRDLDSAWIRFIDRVNALNWRMVSVDVPSGLDADTGLPRGAAVRAEWTLTVGAPKQGLLSASAWEFVGRLEVLAKVGLSEDFLRTWSGSNVDAGLRWVEADAFDGFPPRRCVASHKGTYGHLVIAAGSLGYHGAGVLAARAAAAARPGLVTVLTTPEAYAPVASQLASAMVRPWNGSEALPNSATALIIGPGLAGVDVSDTQRSAVVRWWREWPGAVVADASALDWIRHVTVAPEVGLRVMTPHPGEAARWLGTTAAEVNADRTDSLGRLAASGAWVVLKGHQTRVGGGNAAQWIHSTGNPGLAQGGTGDVLAGFLGGLIAQEGLRSDPERLISYAVWQHGAAADRLEARSRNWSSETLATEIGC